MFHDNTRLKVALLIAMLAPLIVSAAGQKAATSPATMDAMDHDAHSHGAPPDLAQLGGTFALTDHNGRAVTEKDFRGRYALFYFGYARCDVACPAALASMASAINQLGPLAEQVVPVFVDFENSRLDPPMPRGAFNYTETPKQQEPAPAAHDHEAMNGMHDMRAMASPMTQQEFASFVHAVHPRMVGLTGTRYQIWDISAKFQVRWEHEHPVTEQQKELGFRLNHTTHMYLLGPDGKLADVFAYDESAAQMAQRMTEVIHQHLHRNAAL